MRAIYRSRFTPSIDPYDGTAGEAYYDEIIDDGRTFMFFPDEPKSGDPEGIGMYVDTNELGEIE